MFRTTLFVALLLVQSFALHAQSTHSETVEQISIFPGLTGNQLLDSLAANYRPSNVYNYDRARDIMFAEIYNVDGTVTCMYTGDVLAIPFGHSSPRTLANAANWNTEHIYPQSMGASAGNARSDLHHLQPVRADVNSSRGNSPFGFVPDAQATRWWKGNVNQTAIPAGDTGLWSKTFGDVRFEPRDTEKGNAARAIFYFYTIYQAQAEAANTSFFRTMYEDLRAFHEMDKVDAIEVERTYAIATVQDGKVNPFILDTTLVRRVFFENFEFPSGGGDSGETYLADFETANKQSYTAGPVSLGGKIWQLDEVLIGTQDGDLRVGGRSARLRHPASMEMLDPMPAGIGTISFVYGRSSFGGDRDPVAPVIVVEYLTDDEWTQMGEPINLAGINSLTQFSYELQAPGEVFVRIRSISGTNGRRFNIDNIQITPASEGTYTRIVSGEQGWRMLTVPVQNATAADLLRDNVFTQGIPGADVPDSQFPPNVLIFNEALNRYEAPASLNDVLLPGQGFTVWFYPDNDDIVGEDLPVEKLLLISGTEYASRELPLHFTPSESTSGWNFVGNIFPADYPVAELGMHGQPGLNQFVYIWDTATNDYAIYSSDDPDAKIAAFQGFLVKTDQAGNHLIFDRPELTEGAVFYRETYRPEVTLSAKHGTRESRVKIRFKEEGGEAFSNLDAWRLWPMSENYTILYSRKEGNPVSVATYSDFDDTANFHNVFPVFLATTEGGSVVFSASLNDIDDHIWPYLENPETNERFWLNEGDFEYTINQNTAKQHQDHNKTSYFLPDAHIFDADDGESAPYFREFRFGLWNSILSTENGNGLPQFTRLMQNYPNPFNPTTAIRYMLAEAGAVQLSVYDVLGRRVALLTDETLSPGTYSVPFDASGLSSGVYIYRLETPGNTITRKMLLIR